MMQRKKLIGHRLVLGHIGNAADSRQEQRKIAQLFAALREPFGVQIGDALAQQGWSALERHQQAIMATDMKCSWWLSALLKNETTNFMS